MTPSQGAGIIVLSMGDGILTHLPFRSPDPTEARKQRASLLQVLLKPTLT
jgi:hypothetical protein